MSYRRYKSLDKNLIFAEYFNSEQEVRRQNPVLTTATFSKGHFTGGTADWEAILLPSHRIRIVIDFDDPTHVNFRYIVSSGGSDWIRINPNGSLSKNGSFTIEYFNNEPYVAQTCIAGRNEIIIDAAKTSLSVLSSWADDIDGDGIALLEVYNKVLTAEEVSNLYNNARYVVPSLEHGEQVADNGLTNSINFIDTNEDGTPDNWITHNWGQDQINSINNSIVRLTTPSGCSAHELNIYQNTTWTDGVLYKITIKVRVSTATDIRFRNGLSGSDSFYDSETLNPEEWNTITTYYRGGTLGAETALYIHPGAASAGSWWELDWIKKEEVAVEPTSKILHCTARNGVVQNLLAGDTIEGEVVDEPVLTDVEVVKDSPGYVPRFNGSTSKIDCGDYNDLTGDITILAWINPFSNGGSNYGNILNNGTALYLEMGGGVSKRIRFSRDNDSSAVLSVVDSVQYRDYLFVAVVSESDGTTNIYINGEQNGTVDQDAGTPIAGNQNITVGSYFSGALAFDGQLPETIVLSGLLTPKLISQYFSATKHKYQK